MKAIAIGIGVTALLFAGQASADMSNCDGTGGNYTNSCGLEQSKIAGWNLNLGQDGNVSMKPPSDLVLPFDISPTIDLPCSPGNCTYNADTISGSFVYDVTSGTLQSVNLTVSGTYMPGTYNTTANGFNNTNDSAEISSCRAGNCSMTSAILHLWFKNNLSNSDDLVVDVSWDAGALSAPTNQPGADPLPEPASLGLLGGGLLALAVFAVARRRRHILPVS
jgi:hypothetical protein